MLEEETKPIPDDHGIAAEHDQASEQASNQGSRSSFGHPASGTDSLRKRHRLENTLVGLLHPSRTVRSQLSLY
jgi:hypothetical protein